jgi:pyruvate,water dikinase
VSLDASARTVFAGAAWPELQGRLPAAGGGRAVHGLPPSLAAKLTTPSRGFTGGAACRSVHDVVRFAHAVALDSMLKLGDRLLESPVGGVKRLECPAPFYVHVVDLGGALRPGAGTKESVGPDDVASAPFQALWRGVSDPGFSVEPPRARHRSSSGVAVTVIDPALRQLGSFGYAFMTASDLSLASRLAHQLVLVDASVALDEGVGNVAVRMKRGASESWQRDLRAELVADVLRAHHFAVTVTDRFLNASLRGVDAVVAQQELGIIGHLLALVVRVDLQLTDEADVRVSADSFLEAHAAASKAPARNEPAALRRGG